MFKDVVFHNGSTSTGNGTEVFVNRSRALTIEITGTSTSRTISFKAKGPAGILRPITGVKLDGLTTGNSTTGNNELWQFDVTGLYSLQMTLDAVAGGNVSVKGRLVE